MTPNIKVTISVVVAKTMGITTPYAKLTIGTIGSQKNSCFSSVDGRKNRRKHSKK